MAAQWYRDYRFRIHVARICCRRPSDECSRACKATPALLRLARRRSSPSRSANIVAKRLGTDVPLDLNDAAVRKLASRPQPRDDRRNPAARYSITVAELSPLRQHAAARRPLHASARSDTPIGHVAGDVYSLSVVGSRRRSKNSPVAIADRSNDRQLGVLWHRVCLAGMPRAPSPSAFTAPRTQTSQRLATRCR